MKPRFTTAPALPASRAPAAPSAPSAPSARDAAPATRAVRRAACLLAALGAGRGDMSLGALADAAALSKATTFRLLAALELEGFVVRDAARETYALGPALVGLGAQARRSIRLHDAARPVLAALAEEIGETVTLEVLVGAETLILDEVHGHFLVGASPEVGTTWPAHATSTGKVLLAAHPAVPATAFAEGALRKLGPNTIASRAELARELAAVAVAGHATTFEELEPGFAAVAAPVRNADGAVVAAVSIGGPSARLTRERLELIAPRVRDAGDRISQRLGAPPARPSSASTLDA